MCLLTYLPAQVQPDLDALFNGAVANDDGHGFAIVAGRRHNRLIVHRGLNAETVLDAFVAARRQHPDGPALFHSRLATHGDATLDNCHPLVVGGDTRTVLAHNGVLPAAARPAPNDPRSDTRIAAEHYIPALGPLQYRRVREALQRWMTPANKMVILTVDPRFRQRSYLLNEASGIWDNGSWYSNDSYLPAPPTPWTSIDEDWDWEGDWLDGAPYHAVGVHRHPAGRDWCGACGAAVVAADIRAGSTCRRCDSCLGCGEMPEACFCYTPAELDHPAPSAFAVTRESVS